MTRNVVKIVVALLMVIAMWQSGVVAMASIHKLRAERLIDENNEALSNQITSILAFAIALDDRNPRVLASRAKQAFVIGLDDPRVLADARSMYRQLTEIQPSVSEHWAMLFVAKTYLGERDDERAQALMQVVRLGPYEPLANYHVLSAATRDWLGLTAEMRRLVLDMASRTLRSASPTHRSEARQLLKTRGFLPIVCARHGDDVPAAICEAAGT